MKAFQWVSQDIVVEMKHVWESLYLRTIHHHDPRDLSRNTGQNRSETATQNTTVCSFCTSKLKDSKATVISAYPAELNCWTVERLDFAFVAQTICNMTFAWILMVKIQSKQNHFSNLSLTPVTPGFPAKLRQGARHSSKSLRKVCSLAEQKGSRNMVLTNFGRLPSNHWSIVKTPLGIFKLSWSR